MFNYSLTSLKKLGENDPKYGQTYWAYAQETDMGIMFNSMEDWELSEDGPLNVMAEAKEIRMGKKGEYIRLKKVKLAETPTQTEMPVKSAENGSQSNVLGNILTQLDRIDKKLSQLLERDTVHPVNDDEIDLKDIPF